MFKTLFLLGLTAAIPTTGSGSQQNTSPSTPQNYQDGQTQWGIGAQDYYQKSEGQKNQKIAFPDANNEAQTGSNYKEEDIDAAIQEVFDAPQENKDKNDQYNQKTENPQVNGDQYHNSEWDENEPIEEDNPSLFREFRDDY